MWNIDPSTNYNSTAFWHKLVSKLYECNEALIIFPNRGNGMTAACVADSWEESDLYPIKQREYRRVWVDDLEYRKTFRENEVIHMRLNNRNMKPILQGIYGAYGRLVAAAMSAYEWGHGQHWTVTVDQIASGKDGWSETFQKMLEETIRPFLENPSGVLPVTNGYDWKQIEAPANGVKTTDIKALLVDVLEFTARGIGIPPVIALGSTENAENAQQRFLSALDPIADQLEEEINRKRYGMEQWSRGNFVRVDTSTISHFDLFAQAGSVEKLIGSGTFSVNDIRRALGEPLINEPWANEYHMTKNIGQMEPVSGSQ